MRLPPLNVTNGLLWLGTALLGVGLWLPYGTAARVARVEGRAADTVRLILEVSAEFPALLTGAAAADDVAGFAAAVRDRCAAAGHPGSDLPELHGGAEPPILRFTGKHYCFAITRTPPDATELRPLPPADRAIEVYGWPATALSPGRTAFCAAGDARPAYCRNLEGRYLGIDSPPAPGAGRVRKAMGEVWYWGLDGQRWIWDPRG